MLRTTLAALVAACALTACASSARQRRYVFAGEHDAFDHRRCVRKTRAAGNGALPDGSTLKYVSVPQDSRCPPNARCIRAGDADIEFVFAISGGPQATVKANLPKRRRRTWAPGA